MQEVMGILRGFAGWTELVDDAAVYQKTESRVVVLWWISVGGWDDGSLEKNRFQSTCTVLASIPKDLEAKRRHCVPLRCSQQVSTPQLTANRLKLSCH